MKLFFAPEANEKAQTLWHALKLHPYGEDAEGQRERRDAVVSQCYDEVVFTEPVEQFYDILTSTGPFPGQKGSTAAGGASGGAGKGAGKGAGSKQLAMAGARQKGGAGGGGGAGAGQQQAAMAAAAGAGRTAEIPNVSTADNPYSRHEEEKEVARLREAMRKVDVLVREERRRLEEREKTMAGLRKENGGGGSNAAAAVAGGGSAGTPVSVGGNK